MKRRDYDPVQQVFHTNDIPPGFLLAAERLINRIEAEADGENCGAMCFSLAFVLERYLRGRMGRQQTPRVTELLDNLNYLMATLALFASEQPDETFTRQQ